MSAESEGAAAEPTAPAAAETNDERDVRAEFDAARAALTPKQRKFLDWLSVCDMQPWRACTELGYSTHTLHKWRRLPQFRRALDLLREVSTLDADIGRDRVIRNWEQQATADLRLFFRRKVDDKGEPLKSGEFELVPPHLWTHDMAGMVQELSFDTNGQPKVKLYNRQEATLTLAKYNKMISERHEVDLSGAPPPSVEIVERG